MKGWTAGICAENSSPKPPSTYVPPTESSPYPSGTSPYPSPSPPVTTLKKNKFYASKKTALIGKSRTKSAEDCLGECVV